MKQEDSYFRTIRERMHLTQNEIADRMGIARGSYVNLESGKTHVVTDSALRFCKVTGVSLLEVAEACYPQYCGGLLKEDAHYKEMLRQTIDEYEARLEAKNMEIKNLQEKNDLLVKTSNAQQKVLDLYERPSGKND